MKSKKSALLLSFTSLLLCFAMLAGSTFAWFTDTATTGVNQIKSGKLDVDIVDENNNSLDGKSLSFKNANGGDDILWEPGATFFTQGFKIVNKGNLALKYKVVVSGTTGDAKLLEAIKFDVVTVKDKAVDAALTEKGGLLPNGASAPAAENTYYYLRGHMNETANNDYQDLSLNGISITVYATQDTVEYDSFDKTYDEKAGEDTAFYTLAEFNALTAIPEGIKNVYLNIGNVSLKDGSVTIGNKNMADVYTSVTGDYTIGQKLDDGRVVSSVWNADRKIYLANTNKAGITLYVSGSVNENNDNGLNNNTGNEPFPNSLNFVIPDASNIVFTKNFTVNGFFRCGFSWNDNTNLGGGVAGHKVQSVLFDHSTFNGIWIQNGGFNTNSVTLDGCTFNAYENKKFANDSNPLWFCNTGSCDITVKNCSFTASRPIKLAEQSAYGTELTVINNTFDMSAANNANTEGEPKNDAIMLCAIGNGTLGNVVISGNKMENGNALMAFYNPVGFTMASGATFKVSGNTLLNGAKLSVKWKTATEYKPDFVTE